jgi:hypothetical protein
MSLLACLLLASALALSPLPAGAADEAGARVRVTVDGDRVSLLAEAAPIRDIVRAMAERTGVAITAVNAGPLQATVNVEREALEQALERVVRAASPAANATTVYSYDGDRLRAVTIHFLAAPRSPEASESYAAAAEGPGPTESVEAPAGNPYHAVIDELRRAGVPDAAIDPDLVRQLAEGGVPVSEILEQLRLIAASAEDPAVSAAWANDGASSGRVMEWPSEVDRQSVAVELRAAGVSGDLDDAHLMTAHHLRNGGVPWPEIVELLGDMGAVPKPPAPAPQVIATSVSGPEVQALRDELRQAGVPEAQLDETGLIMALQLKDAGVEIGEIKENLALIDAASPTED